MISLLNEEHSLEISRDVKDALSRTFPKEYNKGKQSQSTYALEKSPLLCEILGWLASPPMLTTLRVNTLSCTTMEAMNLLKDDLHLQCITRHIGDFAVRCHHSLPDCLVVDNTGPHYVVKNADMEIIVDHACGMAVQRGADVFQCGILAAPAGLCCGSRVSVMADLDGHCRRGCKSYKGRTLYVGTGISVVKRSDLFCVGQRELTWKDNSIACLMKDKGCVVALDKSADRVSKLQAVADAMNLSCIETYVYDARKAVQDGADTTGSPPYPPNTFDMVLLDGPCSALGQRPIAVNKMSAKCLESFPRIQRSLLLAGVKSLRPGGVLVYSTCTITVEENEDQVSWALGKFPELSLEQQEPHIGGFGNAASSLSPGQCRLLQRFNGSGRHAPGGQCDEDTIGFFIAKFRKKRSVTAPC